MQNAYLVLFEERPANVAIQRVSEVVLQVHQSVCKMGRTFSVVDRQHKQVDKPRQ